MTNVIDILLIMLFLLAFVSTLIVIYIGIIGIKQKLKMRSETYSKWSTCEECEGLGTLRVEDFDPETEYSDYDVKCEACGGSGEINS